jgi:NAD(P)H-dependent FMN reductase
MLSIMKIVLISGSTRANSQSRKVTDYLAVRLQALDAETAILDLNETKLPMYDDTDDGPWKAIWEPVSKGLSEAEGFVFISPEWDGMASVGLFNLLHYVGNQKEMAHKPVMLVGVSSGRGGSYPIAQMKQIGQKNKHYVISPENLVVGDVEKVLVDGKMTVEGLAARADYALKVLLEYGKALHLVRYNGVVNDPTFKNGV